MQANIGLYPNWSWCWPVNRRILYNRASVDLNGKPLNPKKAVIMWDGKKWVGDVPDGPWPPQADKEKGKLAFIMIRTATPSSTAPAVWTARSPNTTNRPKRPSNGIRSPSS